MKWSESLEARIIDETDKILFHEAIKCLNIQCYRAGYIISWISIVESLKRRIAEAETIGDKGAAKAMSKFEAEEKLKKSIDKSIIEESKNIHLIDDAEYAKLEFLWGQRCVFAHPYLREPSEDELKYIISQSVDISLSKPLVYKKPYIKSLIDDISTKFHYFSNNDEVIKEHAESFVSRVDPKLHPFMHKAICAKISELLTDETKEIFINRLQLFDIALLKFSNIPLACSDWRLEDFALQNIDATFRCYINNEIWNKIPIRIKEIAVTYATENKSSKNLIFSRRIIANIQASGNLETRFSEQFSEFIEKISFSEAYEYYSDNCLLAKRVIKELASGFVEKQREVFVFLNTPISATFMSQISEIEKVELGKYCFYAANQGCNAAKGFISKSTGIESPVKAGIFSGCFINRNTLHFQSEYLSQVINSINAENDKDISFIFSIVKSNIKGATRDEFFSINMATELLRNASKSDSFKDVTKVELLELSKIIADIGTPPAILESVL